MSVERVDEVWRRLLPPGVAVSHGTYPDAVAAPLSSRETASLGAATPQRLHEFAAGRLHARQALVAAGQDPIDIPRRCDGAPDWPEGFVGSITHARHVEGSCIAAAVARSSMFSHLGIDAEFVAAIPAQVWKVAFSARDMLDLMRLPVAERTCRAGILWSAREATIKAMGRAIQAGAFDISLCPDTGDFVARAADGSSWPGRSMRAGGWVFAAVSVPARRG